MRDTQREAENRQREKQAPRREPDVGLDPGSQDHDEPKAGAQLLSHPGIPKDYILITKPVAFL